MAAKKPAASTVPSLRAVVRRAERSLVELYLKSLYRIEARRLAALRKRRKVIREGELRPGVQKLPADKSPALRLARP